MEYLTGAPSQNVKKNLATPTMIFDRLANEHPETCTWKQQEIPCSSKGSFVGSHAVVPSGEVHDAGFANPVENCFVKNYHDVDKLEVKQKV